MSLITPYCNTQTSAELTGSWDGCQCQSATSLASFTRAPRQVSPLKPTHFRLDLDDVGGILERQLEDGEVVVFVQHVDGVVAPLQGGGVAQVCITSVGPGPRHRMKFFWSRLAAKHLLAAHACHPAGADLEEGAEGEVGRLGVGHARGSQEERALDGWRPESLEQL